MFFNFPLLKGLYLYYQEYWVLMLMIYGLTASLIFFVISKCFLGDLLKPKKKYQPLEVEERLIEMQDNDLQENNLNLTQNNLITQNNLSSFNLSQNNPPPYIHSQSQINYSQNNQFQSNHSQINQLQNNHSQSIHSQNYNSQINRSQNNLTQSQAISPQQTPKIKKKKAKKNSIYKNIIGLLSLILSALTLSWGITAITAFRYLPTFYSIVSNFVIYNLTFAYLVYIISPGKRRSKSNVFSVFREFIGRQKALCVAIMTAILIGSFILPLMSYGTCICPFEDEEDTFKLFDWQPFNTKLLRYQNIPESCPELLEICFVYPTLPSDATTSVFINIHSHKSIVESLNLTLWSGNNQFRLFYSQVFQFDDLDEYNDRNVHTFVISDLEPNTQYSLQISIRGLESQFYNYKTLPDKLEDKQELNIVNGGDIGNSQMAIQIWRALALVKPDIIFIGGDISYDNNLIDCVWTMDYLLRHYQELTVQVGRLIPLVLAIGNHDIGLNAGAYRSVILLDGKAKPIYYSFFPQHYEVGRVDRQVPLVSNRLSYFYHTFADILFFTLDTEYAASMESQAYWIDSIIQLQVKPQIKMAHYHNPIFWACFGHRDDAIVFQNGIQYWVPRFDKYNFSTNFENHAHEQKRTKPLKGTSEAENGTLYLGDGSWGATIEPCAGTENPDYIDNWQANGSVWVTTITNRKLEHRALTIGGQILDYAWQMTPPYLN